MQTTILEHLLRNGRKLAQLLIVLDALDLRINLAADRYNKRLPWIISKEA